MRRLAWTFIILSPLLALAQSGVPAHLAAQATVKVAGMIHAIQVLLA